MDFSKKQDVSETKLTQFEGDTWEVNQMQAQSETKIEDDIGTGAAAIIRMFEFGINYDAFSQHQPTKQELFDSHKKGIEIMLWKDGMAVMDDVPPKVTMGKKSYRIFVGAKPLKGHILTQKPQTLSEIVHGKS